MEADGFYVCSSSKCKYLQKDLTGAPESMPPSESRLHLCSINQSYSILYVGAFLVVLQGHALLTGHILHFFIVWRLT